MKRLKSKINQIIKNYIDYKDLVHCILYFIKECERLSD